MTFQEIETALREWAEQMDQWERVAFRDSCGNIVYVHISYLGDGYEYSDLDNEGQTLI